MQPAYASGGQGVLRTVPFKRPAPLAVQLADKAPCSHRPQSASVSDSCEHGMRLFSPRGAPRPVGVAAVAAPPLCIRARGCANPGADLPVPQLLLTLLLQLEADLKQASCSRHCAKGVKDVEARRGGTGSGATARACRTTVWAVHPWAGALACDVRCAWCVVRRGKGVLRAPCTTSAPGRAGAAAGLAEQPGRRLHNPQRAVAVTVYVCLYTRFRACGCACAWAPAGLLTLSPRFHLARRRSSSRRPPD